MLETLLITGDMRRHRIGYGNADFIEKIRRHVGAIPPDSLIQISVEMNAFSSQLTLSPPSGRRTIAQQFTAGISAK
jgi:hypothetical protein